MINRTLASTEHSDLKVKIGHIELKVHKIIVCSLSKFFEKACRNFKVSVMEQSCLWWELLTRPQEAQTGVIELHHGDHKILQCMMAWFNTGGYCDREGCRENNAPKIKTIASDENTQQNGATHESTGPESYKENDDAQSGWGPSLCHSLLLEVQLFALAGKLFLTLLNRTSNNLFTDTHLQTFMTYRVSKHKWQLILRSKLASFLCPIYGTLLTLLRPRMLQRLRTLKHLVM